MARNKSEKKSTEKLLAYARACRRYFATESTFGIGDTWKAIGFNGRLEIDHMSRSERMLHIFSKHGTTEEKLYRGP